MKTKIDPGVDSARIAEWTEWVEKLDPSKREHVIVDINHHVQEWKDHGHTDQWLDYAIAKLFSQHGVP
jgi:hypothetical protein